MENTKAVEIREFDELIKVMESEISVNSACGTCDAKAIFEGECVGKGNCLILKEEKTH